MTRDQKIIGDKLGLLELTQTLGSMSEACKVLGFSRNSFYRLMDFYGTGGEAAPAEISRKKQNSKNRTDPAIKRVVVEFALEQPALRQVRSPVAVGKDGAAPAFRWVSRGISVPRWKPLRLQRLGLS